jgi:DNA-binding NtrC family response regulator
MYKILIADNQREWLKFSRGVLASQGYQVILVETVAKLHQLLEDDGYDLILINADLMFGKFREPIHSLFSRNADKPIIVVSVPSSTHRTVQETRTAFRLGAKDCVDKPFSSERLLSLVQQLLAEFGDRRVERQEVQPCH